jgi:FkbM family methyltransferase
LYLILVHPFELARRGRFFCTGAVVVDGAVFYLQPGDTYLTQYVLDWGCYEPTETELFKSKIRPGDTVVDVGANIGWFTVIASKLVGKEGRVIAFEPEPTSFEYLKRNVEANGCTNVVLEQKALSNEAGEIELFTATEHLGQHRISDWGDGRRAVKVEALPLDDYLAGSRISVDVIKIDTEGAEGVIVEGMEETLKRSRNVKLFMEYLPENLRRSGYDPIKLLQRLEAHGFQFHAIGEGQRRVVPVRDADAIRQAQVADPQTANLYLERLPSDQAE